ncbi:AraC family transcriptional regulator [Pararhizobium sp. IMCC21322]|uniref:helix-turn-helix domain-containing protein n=1 Tax=Pararhizobium sp. IMCC21322 TaxID=3067903 RepID=UPI0027427936|nr:AraC family transcriptional regulator [Pararhizobium sp. IMCC21322]
MPVLPIPLVVALILGFLFVRALFVRDKSWLFLALIVSCAIQSVVISLNQHYGFTVFHFVQPVTASLVPPLAYLAFKSSALKQLSWSTDLVHLLGPAFIAFCVWLAPVALDVAVSAMFIGYGGYMIWRMWNGRDSLLLTKLDADQTPLIIWRAIAVALMLSAFSDILIIADQIFGSGTLRPWIVSVFSSLTLLVLGLLSLSKGIEGVSDSHVPDVKEPTEIRAEDVAIANRLQDLIMREKLFLDPDLTIGRLSRRLGIPSKQLSAAINKSTGENISRYINRFRIDYACSQMVDGKPVTTAMYDSGFNTKSNFNREFLRIKGCAPRDYISLNS